MLRGAFYMIIRLAVSQFGFELDTFPVLIKWKRSRQDGGANLYPLQLVYFLEKNRIFLKIAYRIAHKA